MIKSMKKIAGYISAKELIFDLIIVLFTAFILGLINPEGKKLIDTVSPAGIFLLGLGINFTITLFMGSLYRQYCDHFSAPLIMVLIKIVFFLGITGAYLALILFFAASHVMPWSGQGGEMDMLLVLIPAFPIFWGLICGFRTDEIDDIKYVLYIPMTITVPMVPIGAAIIGYHIRWHYGVIAFFAFILALVLPYLARVVIETKLKAKSAREMKSPDQAVARAKRASAVVNKKMISLAMVSRAVQSAWDNLLLPTLTALALLFWQNITVEMLVRAYRNWNLPPDTNIVFWSLFLSGIVPLRILLQLAPPLKPVNMALTASALGYYIFSLFRTFH